MMTLDMQNARIVCWSLDESRVLIVPRYPHDRRQVWCRVDFDETRRRYYCVWHGQSLHLGFA